MEQISNKALKELLLQYNISNQDIKGSGKKGKVLKSDRMREYLKLTKPETNYPSDLHYRFLKEANINPNYINQYLRQQYTQDVMGSNCLIPIKRFELKNYIKSNNPFLYCEFIVTPIDEYDYSYYHGIVIRPLTKEDYSYSFYNSSVFEYVVTDEDKTIGFGAFEESPFEWKYDHKDLYATQTLPDNTMFLCYDLVTTYYILKNRLSCRDNFAKKAVIDTFDYIVNNAPIEKLFLYLLCNAKIMGITLLDSSIEWSVEDDLDKIKQHVQTLIPIIKKYLTILDDTIYVDQPKYILEEGKAYVKEYF